MKRTLTIASMLCLLIFLIDSRTVVSAAGDGVSLCLKSVIPSLLPFMILSGLIRKLLTGQKLVILSPLRKLCHIPEGSEILWLLGTLGGYPIGAHCINEAYIQGSLSREDAERMLGCCCNCGPAFLFGIIGCMLENRRILWLIWGVHIISSLLTGWIIPTSGRNGEAVPTAPENNTDILLGSIRSLSLVCVWVILFRIITSLLENMFLFMFKTEAKILIVGILELTNGCLLLDTASSLGLQFILSTTMLAFGGICVLIQTRSVTKDIGLGVYFPGKILQTIISFFLCSALQTIVLPKEQQFQIPSAFLLIAALFLVLTIIFLRKKVVAFRKSIVYNRKKLQQRG